MRISDHALVFFFRVLHTIFSHVRAHAFARPVTVTRSSAVSWHVCHCQAVFPEPQSAAACKRVEWLFCAHEALPRLQSASSWLVMEQLVSGVCRLSTPP